MVSDTPFRTRDGVNLQNIREEQSVNIYDDNFSQKSIGFEAVTDAEVLLLDLK